MNIHEYQAKALLRSYGVPVSDGRVVLRAEEAKTAAGELDGPLWVVKAQIHAGGRGKGQFKEPEAGEKGGVRLARRWKRPPSCPPDAGPHAGHASDRPRRQAGQPHLYRRRLGHRRELYLALLIDRQTSRISFVASTEGGMDIEDVAHDTPEKILSFTVDPATGIRISTAAASPLRWGWKGKQVKQCVGICEEPLQGCSSTRTWRCWRSTR
jgi:succinyl-CoA synthetase beta subunit